MSVSSPSFLFINVSRIGDTLFATPAMRAIEKIHTLRETAALMSCTDLYVGVDTGPTHLMSTFDIPRVGLHHCISSSKLTGLADHPCFYAVDRPRARDRCTEQTGMAEISVEPVLARVQQTLAGHPPLRPRPQAATRFA